jgi:anti-anti-sigma regulatory factor
MMHFVSRSWQVEDVEDGTVVTLSETDLEDTGLGDELMEMFRENGRAKLYLDLRNVRSMSSAVGTRLHDLDQRLQKAGGRLVMCNLAPALGETLPK